MPVNLSADIEAPSHGAAMRGAATAAFAFLYAALFAVMIGGVTGPFAIDESLYLAMADAMATRGDLAIQGNGGVDGAPSLMFALSGYGADGRIYPQYPAGYAYIAAPFYAAFGVDGLFLLNAVAGLIAIYFVRDIAQRLYRDDRIALLATALFAACTFFPTYAFAIWPHVLTLAMLLGAASAALCGAHEGRVRHPMLALSGALIAAATTVRVDSVIFFAPIFIWLRLAAAPSARLPAITFFAGAIPFLALATWFNVEKYGIATPITYGKPSDYETVMEYAPLAVSAIIAAIALIAIDISTLRAPALRLIERRATGKQGVAIAAALIIAAAPLHRPLISFAHHLWTLLIDLQAYNGDYFHDVLTRDDKGFLTTFGLPKKALLQSMPFFAIALLPIAQMLRGKDFRAASFCFLFAAAPIVFFALKQWHGGYALNMRFFFPAVPFLVILSAAAIVPQFEGSADAAKRFFLALAGGCVGLVFLQLTLIDLLPGYGVVVTTHPPLIAALALAIGAATYLHRRNAATSGALLIAAGVAVGAAGASNLNDFLLTKHMRSQSGLADAHFSATLPEGSLVISYEETRLVRTFTGGVSLFHPYEGEERHVADAIAAFDRAGRCVYVKKGEIADFVAAATGAEFISAAANASADLDWFDTLAPARPGCMFP